MSRKDILKLGLILLVLVCAVGLYSRISAFADRDETELVRRAVREAALTCYAVEGAYPGSVEYLREHYRLAYDSDRYYVTLEAFASNQIPDIFITMKGAQEP